jgi:hypothetical protein
MAQNFYLVRADGEATLALTDGEADGEDVGESSNSGEGDFKTKTFLENKLSIFHDKNPPRTSKPPTKARATKRI